MLPTILYLISNTDSQHISYPLEFLGKSETQAHHVPQTERDIYESFCVGLPEPIAYLEVRD